MATTVKIHPLNFMKKYHEIFTEANRGAGGPGSLQMKPVPEQRNLAVVLEQRNLIWSCKTLHLLASSRQI
jgi:hypothetical protein